MKKYRIFSPNNNTKIGSMSLWMKNQVGKKKPKRKEIKNRNNSYKNKKNSTRIRKWKSLNKKKPKGLKYKKK